MLSSFAAGPKRALHSSALSPVFSRMFTLVYIWIACSTLFWECSLASTNESDESKKMSPPDSSASIRSDPHLEGADITDVIRRLDDAEDERSILEKFYAETGGSKWWKDRTGWLENNDVCTWFGIRCTPSGTVTEIEFDTNHLNGTIPSEIFLLPDLTQLDIFNESAVDVSLELFSKAKRLTDVYLYNTNITSLKGIGGKESGESSLQMLLLKFSRNLVGSIPTSIGHLTNLLSLSIANNPKLTGTIPASIGYLTNLMDLHLHYNRLKGKIPLSIGNLESLISFNAEGNFLTGQLPYTIGNIYTLEELHLGFNDFKGTLPKIYADLPNLAILKLGPMDVRKKPKFGLKGKLLDFSNAPSLYHLDLSFNQISGTIPRNLLSNNIENTKYILNLESNRISGALPNTLHQFKTLDLNVDGNMISSIEIDMKIINQTDFSTPKNERLMLYNWNQPAVYWYGIEGLLCKPGYALNIDKYVKGPASWWYPCARCDDWFLNNTMWYDERVFEGMTKDKDFVKFAPFWGSKECVVYSNGTKKKPWEFLINKTSSGTEDIITYSIGSFIGTLLSSIFLVM